MNKISINNYIQPLVVTFLLMVTFFVFYQVKNHDFIEFDDYEYVVYNIYVIDGLSFENIKWAFRSGHVSNWHPITWISHMIDCSLYGLNPAGHHLTNVIFHILNTLLLFLVLKKMTGSFWPSLFTAALFALHPFHVESVAWVAERKDILSTFFGMLVLLSYSQYTEDNRYRCYFFCLLFFILGLMAKPMLITLPFVLLLLDFWPLKRVRSTEGINHDTLSDGNNNKNHSIVGLIVEKIPFFILSVIFSGITFIVQKKGGAVRHIGDFPIITRISNAFVSYQTYIVKTIWPYPLAVLYSYPVNKIPMIKVTGSVLLIGFITIIAIKRCKKDPYFLVGWLWYLGTLVPVIGLVQVGIQSMADRYTYIPLIGLFIIISWGIPKLFSGFKYKQYLITTLAFAVLLIFSIFTWKQLQHWRDSRTLFEHAVNKIPQNYGAHSLLGVSLIKESQIDKACDNFSRALEINPNYTGAHYNYGNALYMRGDIKGAISHYLDALVSNRNFAGAHYQLGFIFGRQNKIKQALAHYDLALKINSDLPIVLNNKAWLLATTKDKQLRNVEMAIKLAKKACELTKTSNALFLDTLSVAYAEANRFSEAINWAQKALELALRYGDDSLSEEIKKKIQSYKKKV